MAKTRQIVECVPNFSEGRDKTVIKQITDVDFMHGFSHFTVDFHKARYA